MNRLLLKSSKYLSSFREGYAVISHLIPIWKLINSIAAGEYAAGLVEDMGPEVTGEVQWDLVGFGPKMSSSWLRYVDSILQVSRCGMGLV